VYQRRVQPAGAFVSAPHRVLTREQLLALSRLHDAEVHDRTIDVQVWRLRKKIETPGQTATMIRTERGVGYVFDARSLPFGDRTGSSVRRSSCRGTLKTCGGIARSKFASVQTETVRRWRTPIRVPAIQAEKDVRRVSRRIHRPCWMLMDVGGGGGNRTSE